MKYPGDFPIRCLSHIISEALVPSRSLCCSPYFWGKYFLPSMCRKRGLHLQFYSVSHFVRLITRWGLGSLGNQQIPPRLLFHHISQLQCLYDCWRFTNFLFNLTVYDTVTRETSPRDAWTPLGFVTSSLPEKKKTPPYKYSKLILILILTASHWWLQIAPRVCQRPQVDRDNFGILKWDVYIFEFI